MTDEITPAAIPPQNPVAVVRGQLEAMRPQIEMVLPPQVTADRFMRVTMTAIQQNPSVLNADRKSLFGAAMKAAQDGLLPDGREAAFVVFKSRVQYMPMVAGVLKKIRQSGELSSLSCNVVYAHDAFRFWIDDSGEHIEHEPSLLAEDRGPLTAVYAIARTKDGGVYTEVMSRGQVDQVRSVSRAANDGPWVSWYDEMARKTCIRRLAKRLPMSTDVQQLFSRDNDMYDLRSAETQKASSGNEAAAIALGLLDQDAGDE